MYIVYIYIVRCIYAHKPCVLEIRLVISTSLSLYGIYIFLGGGVQIKNVYHFCVSCAMPSKTVVPLTSLLSYLLNSAFRSIEFLCLNRKRGNSIYISFGNENVGNLFFDNEQTLERFRMFVRTIIQTFHSKRSPKIAFFRMSVKCAQNLDVLVLEYRRR